MLRAVLQSLALVVCLFSAFFLAANSVKAEVAGVVSEKKNTVAAISAEFQQKFHSIEAFMGANQDEIRQAPEHLFDFVDQELMQVWSAELTIKAMLGRKRWKMLDETERETLIAAYKETMQRYLFEVMAKYNGQQALVDSVQLNDKGNKGWLTAKLVVKNFPDLKVDLKLYQKPATQNWQIYDFRFQGISFIKMKQSEYQSIFDKAGTEALVKLFNDKNQSFRDGLAVSD